MKLNTKRQQVYLLMLSILVCLFAILVKFQSVMHFCSGIHALKSIHLSCAYLMSNFPDKFPNQIYASSNCINNNNSSSHHFASRTAFFMFDICQDFITEQYEKWSDLSLYSKVGTRYLTFPCPNTYRIVPAQEHKSK